jgi:glucokinase
MTTSYVIAGDVGGTKTALTLFKAGDGILMSIYTRTFKSAEWNTFLEVVAEFVANCLPVKIEAACFGVAGPVQAGVCKATNLPWLIDSHELASLLNLSDDRVVLLNDLEALAHGVGILPESDFLVLNEGVVDPFGNRAVIAAGTGLGEAGMFFDRQTLRHRPFATENGHVTFGPQTIRQAELLNYLLKSGQVSWEMVLSGPGLYNIYKFLLSKSGQAASSDKIAAGIAPGDDPSAAISRAALSGEDELCREALDLFVELYGVEAGNLALKVMATGGIYVGGGIAPKIVERLRRGDTFMSAFVDKCGNNISALLRNIPVKIVLNSRAGLLGAGYYATLMVQTASSETPALVVHDAVDMIGAEPRILSESPR